MITETQVRVALQPANLYEYLKQFNPTDQVGSPDGVSDCVVARYLNTTFKDSLGGNHFTVGYYATFLVDISNMNNVILNVYYGPGWIETYLQLIDRMHYDAPDRATADRLHKDRSATTAITFLHKALRQHDLSLI